MAFWREAVAALEPEAVREILAVPAGRGFVPAVGAFFAAAARFEFFAVLASAGAGVLVFFASGLAADLPPCAVDLAAAVLFSLALVNFVAFGLAFVTVRGFAAGIGTVESPTELLAAWAGMSNISRLASRAHADRFNRSRRITTAVPRWVESLQAPEYLFH